MKIKKKLKKAKIKLELKEKEANEQDNNEIKNIFINPEVQKNEDIIKDKKKIKNNIKII